MPVLGIGAGCVERFSLGSDPTNGRLSEKHTLPWWRALCVALWAQAGIVACRVVTWLILPVVICLSQRLSHACLSINLYTVRLRMAH